MIRKPTSGDSEQRQREAEKARRSSQLSAAGETKDVDSLKEENQQSHRAARPAHGGSDGESAHGAIPRSGIEFEQTD